jgi:hypothetical protein
VAPAERRATANRLFSAGYGVAWSLGRDAHWLYDWSVPSLVILAGALQLLAIPLLMATSCDWA